MNKIIVLLIALMLILASLAYSSQQKEPKLKDKLAFVFANNLWMSNSDGTERKQLSGYGGVSEPSWSPDGKYIVFVCDDTLWRYDFSTGKSSRFLYNIKGNCVSPCWSPSGKEIIFTHETASWDTITGKNYTEICAVNSDGSNFHVVVDSKGKWKCYPRFSPWEEKIIFNELRSNTPGYYIASYNFATSSVVYLSSEAGWFEPAFSPKGDIIAAGWYSSYEGGGLCIFNTKTREKNYLVNLTKNCQYTSPSFSKDGEKIVFEKDFFSKANKTFIPYGIYVINKNGSGCSELILDGSDPDLL